MSKNENANAPRKLGAPNKLGPGFVVHTVRLTQDIYQGVLRQKVAIEIATGKSMSMSAAVLDLLALGIKAADRKRKA
jgi:hypothetical protein